MSLGGLFLKLAQHGNRKSLQPCPRCGLLYPADLAHCPHCGDMDATTLERFKATLEQERAATTNLGRLFIYAGVLLFFLLILVALGH